MNRVMIRDANSNCFKNNMIIERIAITVNETLTGSLSSSPNVSLWRKNTTMLEIHAIKYMMMEKMFMGAVIFCKKFFGKI
jgi:hypothetical protein